MDKETYWKEKEENTEIKIKFASCDNCGKSTYISNNLRVGVTLYEHEGKYYCFNHHPIRKEMLRNHDQMGFSRTIDKMRRISGIKTGNKKLASLEKRIRV